MHILLASASPRRRELLEGAGFALEIVVPNIDETRAPDEAPAQYAARLASEKAHAVLKRAGAKLPIVAADTIVVSPSGAVLGKPTDEDDAACMLRELSGGTHEVVTAFCILRNGHEHTRAVVTEVTFRTLSDEDVARYLASGEWKDKAGGYAIQGLAAAFVPRIDGSYTNVVGLPLCEVIEALR